MSAVPPSRGAFGSVVPDGWTLELLPRQSDQALLTVPSGCYFVTIDFRSRGIRTGYSTTSTFLGEAWNKRRKKYVGSNWKQELVDDAVDHLHKLLPADNQGARDVK